jgi:T5orf172 domain
MMWLSGHMTLADESIDALQDPGERIRAEIERAFSEDTSTVGDVWNRLQAGETPDEIARAHDNGTNRYVTKYRSLFDVIRGLRPIPAGAPSIASTGARLVRRLLKQDGLNVSARTFLVERLSLLEQAATDPIAVNTETRKARESTKVAEAANVPGIYVYSLPHYLLHRIEDDRTLLKVGHSSRPVIQRFREQTRTTALPEDPVLLRVYAVPDDGSHVAEQTFHALLIAADHRRSEAKAGGTEWFCTTVRFLDEIAKALNLVVEHVSDQAD